VEPDDEGPNPKRRPRLPKHQYEAYMAGPRWAARKESYFRRHPRECAACGDPEVHLHHMDYVFLGCEPDHTLVALCEHHHALAHEFAGWHPELTLAEATNVVVVFSGGHDLQAGPLTPSRGQRQALEVACPRCKAIPGQPCLRWQDGTSHEMVGTHQKRQERAVRS